MITSLFNLFVNTFSCTFSTAPQMLAQPVIAGLLFIIFACWGSFLNVVAYRSITDKPFFQKRSTCNFCNKIIAWYDNIPILSWFLLKGKCRNCKKNISFLYPLIELTSAIVFTSLFFHIFNFAGIYFFNKNLIISFFAYFIFFSALIVATRTDLQDLVIPQIFSIYLVSVGFIFSYLGFLEIGIYQSLLGAIFGYAILWGVAKLFKLIAKKDGLGVGDMELLALIGAFLGPLGIWISLLVGSVTGLFLATIYLLVIKKNIRAQIPFGPFLALGAVIYFFFKEYFLLFLMG